MRRAKGIFKLTAVALEKINTPEIRRELMAAFGNAAESTIYRYIATNDDNLTKYAALRVIRNMTGLTDEQILEEKVKSEESALQN